MIEELQFFASGSHGGQDALSDRLATWRPGGTLAQSLQCKSSEDGDGATALVFSRKESGRMPVPLQFTVPRVASGDPHFTLGGENGSP